MSIAIKMASSMAKRKFFDCHRSSRNLITINSPITSGNLALSVLGSSMSSHAGCASLPTSNAYRPIETMNSTASTRNVSILSSMPFIPYFYVSVCARVIPPLLTIDRMGSVASATCEWEAMCTIVRAGICL